MEMVLISGESTRTNIEKKKYYTALFLHVFYTNSFSQTKM
jgi:hypothetical protein